MCPSFGLDVPYVYLFIPRLLNQMSNGPFSLAFRYQLGPSRFFGLLIRPVEFSDSDIPLRKVVRILKWFFKHLFFSSPAFFFPFFGSRGLNRAPGPAATPSFHRLLASTLRHPLLERALLSPQVF